MPETGFRECPVCDDYTPHIALRSLVDVASGSTEWECKKCGHIKEVSWR
jgi:hypothetical protein